MTRINLLNIKGNWGKSSAKDLNEDDIQRWKTSNCKQKDRADNLSAAYYLAHQFLNPVAITAWRDCKLNQAANKRTLACFAEPSSNDVRFVYTWIDDDPEFLPVVHKIYVRRSGRESPAVGPRPKNIRKGPNEFSVSRDGSKDMRIGVRATITLT
jgi:hypothetical protein